MIFLLFSKAKVSAAARTQIVLPEPVPDSKINCFFCVSVSVISCMISFWFFRNE